MPMRRTLNRLSLVGALLALCVTATATTDIHNDGKVLLHGEYWNVSSDRPIPAGARVRVVRVQGLKIEVDQIDTKA